MEKTISPKWSSLAKSILGEKNGRHCHWCEFANPDEGEVTCLNEKSEFCDGDRIRTWDGIKCASRCGAFKLDVWYTNDKNYDITFKGVA